MGNSVEQCGGMCGTVWWNSVKEQCGRVWNSFVEQWGTVEVCNNGTVWNSEVEHWNSVVEQCGGTEEWCDGTV